MINHDCHRLARFAIERLPYDIMHRVFIICYADFIFSEEDVNPLQVPILLSHVNQLWRHIALSIPLLWSPISITGLLEDDPTGIKLLDRTKACLSRSKTHPLFVKIQIAHSRRDKTLMPSLHKSVELLVAHANRWHSLNVQAPRCTLLMMAQARGSLDSLTNVRVFPLGEADCIHLGHHSHMEVLDVTKWTTQISHSYENAPSLKGVHYLMEIDYQLPWENLQSWSGSATPAQLNALYCRAHKLTTLRLQGFLFSFQEIQSFSIPPTIDVLPNLTSLHLTIGTFNHGLFFRHVSPSLLRLRRLSLVVSWGSVILDPLVKFLSSLPDTIASFSLLGDFPSSIAAQILSAVPQSNITHLKVVIYASVLDNNSQPDVLAELMEQSCQTLDGASSAGSKEDHPICPFPRLRSLQVGQYPLVPNRAFLQFLRSRFSEAAANVQAPKEVIAPLRLVDLSYFSGPKFQRDLEETKGYLRMLERRGLVLRITDLITPSVSPFELAALTAPLNWRNEMNGFAVNPWRWSVLNP